MFSRILITAPILAAALAGGCSQEPDALLGTYCEPSGVVRFDGQGGLTFLANDGSEMEGRYEFDPETDAISLTLAGGTISATRSLTGDITSATGTSVKCDIDLDEARAKIEEGRAERERRAAESEREEAERQKRAEAAAIEARKPDFVAKALAPMFAETARQDVLGLKLGMTPEEVAGTLTAKGFQAGGLRDRTMRYGDFSIRHAQNARFAKGGVSEGMADRVVAYFTIGSRPRLHALYRNTSYYGNDEVPFGRMMQTIESKYGAPDRSVEAGYKGGETHLTWSDTDKLGCNESTHDFFALDNAQGGAVMKNSCFRGLLIELHQSRDKEPPAVGMVETYLVDTSLGQTGESLVVEHAERLRDRKRKEGLANAQSAEL